MLYVYVIKNLPWSFCAALALLTGPASLAGEQPIGERRTVPAGVSGMESLDEEWLHAVWTQVDEMVKEETRLKTPVSSAGVPPPGKEIDLFDRLYYRGGKRYPGREEIRRAILVLEEAVAADPKSEGAPKQMFLVAQCYQKLGRLVEANSLYTRLTRDHPGTPWAARASKALAKLAGSGRATR